MNLEVYEFPIPRVNLPQYTTDIKYQSSQNKSRDVLNISYSKGQAEITATDNILIKILKYYPEYRNKGISRENVRPPPLNELNLSNILDKIKQKNIYPCVEMMEIPEKSHIIIFGDIHGSVHTIARTLLRLASKGLFNVDTFKITARNTYIFFLGDIVDKGQYGYECIYLLSKLKYKNPDYIKIIQGNHDISSALHKYSGFYFQLNEINKLNTYDKYLETWKYFPIAVIIKKNNEYLQFCHGGFSESLEMSKLRKGYNRISEEQAEEILWSDFSNSNDLLESTFNINRNAGRIYNSNVINSYFKKNNMIALFRGHQDRIANFALLMKDKKQIADYKMYKKEIQLEKTKDLYGVKIPIEKNTEYHSVFTFTTATQPYNLDGDSFGILNV